MRSRPAWLPPRTLQVEALGCRGGGPPPWRRGPRRLVADREKRLLAEGQGRFERLAELVGDARVQEFDRVLAVPGAGEDRHQGELGPGEFGDALGRLPVVDADQDRAGRGGPGRVQDVKARAVAVI